jgi:hypothetical protein
MTPLPAFYQCLQHHTSGLLCVPSLTPKAVPCHQMQISHHALPQQGFGLSTSRGTEGGRATPGNGKRVATREGASGTVASATEAPIKRTYPAGSEHAAAQIKARTSGQEVQNSPGPMAGKSGGEQQGRGSQCATPVHFSLNNAFIAIVHHCSTQHSGSNTDACHIIQHAFLLIRCATRQETNKP